MFWLILGFIVVGGAMVAAATAWFITMVVYSCRIDREITQLRQECEQWCEMIIEDRSITPVIDADIAGYLWERSTSMSYDLLPPCRYHRIKSERLALKVRRAYRHACPDMGMPHFHVQGKEVARPGLLLGEDLR